MPELPEVETIARRLRQGTESQPSIVGKTITGVELFWHRTLAVPELAAFTERITGQAIVEIGRRGKLLCLRLSEDTLLIHLRMSGDILIEPSEEPMATHHRLVLYLESGYRLAFNDTRKFGRVWLLDDPEELFARLGPEPFDPALTPQAFYEMLQSRHRQLKPLLLDQSFLAGLGNIYTDEALHRARLHPLRLASSLTVEEAGRLLSAIRAALQDGIKADGASIDWVYRGGSFQHHFRVYDRKGKPCTTCGTPIQRILVGQRSTFFCPVCQAIETVDTEEEE